MSSVPTNKALYARVKSEAKSKFKVWPSAYGSGWLVKEYKRRGGKYRVISKSRRKSTKKRRKSTKKRRKSTKKRRKSTKKRRKSTKKRRKSTKKRRKSTKKRRKSTKKRRKSTKKRRKSSKKRSRAPVKKTSPIKSYYKKSPIASKPKNRKKSKGKSRITIHRRPQLSREMSVENRDFYRPRARLPRPDERIPLELRRRSRDQYLARLSRPGAQQIPPLPPYRGSRAPKRTKKKPKRRKSKSKKRKSKRSIQSGLGRWFAEEWINVCKLPKIVPCGRNKAKWKNYPYCRPRRRINKGTPKTAGELSKAEIDRRCKRKKDNPKKKVRGKSRKKSTKKRSRAPVPVFGGEFNPITSPPPAAYPLLYYDYQQPLNKNQLELLLIVFCLLKRPDNHKLFFYQFALNNGMLTVPEIEPYITIGWRLEPGIVSNENIQPFIISNQREVEQVLEYLRMFVNNQVQQQYPKLVFFLRFDQARADRLETESSSCHMNPCIIDKIERTFTVYEMNPGIDVINQFIVKSIADNLGLRLIYNSDNDLMNPKHNFTTDKMKEKLNNVGYRRIHLGGLCASISIYLVLKNAPLDILANDNIIEDMYYTLVNPYINYWISRIRVLTNTLPITDHTQRIVPGGEMLNLFSRELVRCTGLEWTENREIIINVLNNGIQSIYGMFNP